MRYIYKTLRITAWLLVGATGLTMLFGFLAYKPYITHHITPDLSTYLHNIFLPLVFAPLFFIHSLCGTFMAIKRQQWIKNKKVWQIGASILWFGALAVLGVLYFVQPPQAKNSAAKSQNSSASQPATSASPAQTLTLVEISKHNSQSDCWMIIDNKVYNLTSYCMMHPGGGSGITSYCGADGTNAFNTKDKSNPKSHSSYATGLLDSYYIGDVGAQADSSKIQPTQSQSTTNSGGSRSGEDD
ncbi:MAG: cytochrome b5 domain-containing protein [bacterium]|nr:cytochrome b5 domain-containing protein [bacterium]